MTRLCAAVFVLVFAWAWPAKATTAVWIDTDAACGKGPFVDVDDCWALGLALTSTELDVRGISTVFGNADGATVHDTVLDIVGSLHPTSAPPVFRGADDASHAVPTEAVDALRQALDGDELTIIALGPLTNIAALIEAHPTYARRITRIIAVMGRQPGEVFHVGANPFVHLHDMNVRKDPDAVRTVLASGIPLTVMSFKASRHIIVTSDDLDLLGRQGGFAAELADMSAPWLSVWRHLFWAEGFRPFDTLPVLYVIAPDAFGCNPVAVLVTPTRALTTYNVALEVAETAQPAHAIEFCDEAEDTLHPMLLRSIVSSP